MVHRLIRWNREKGLQIERNMELKVIAYARNGHTDKFGIPRQSRDESPILTRIVFEPEYNVAEALRGIEGYSHLWLIWGFSASRPASPERPSQSDCKTANAVGSQAELAVGQSWSPTVRPPRLGGNKRMGVFATRSPFRPNPIGMSSVRLLAVRLNEKLKIKNCELSDKSTDRDFDISKSGIRESSESGRMELIVSGADLLDGTPIYDIKPYLSFSDSHPEARNGFAEETKDYQLEVDWSQTEGLSLGCPGFLSAESRENHAGITRESRGDASNFDGVRKDIEYILRQDPRPGYQNDPEREYKMDYGGWRVTFKVQRDEVQRDEVQRDEVQRDEVQRDEGQSTMDQGTKGRVVVTRVEKIL